MRRWAAEGVKAQTCVTSPPYFGLRDYGHAGQIGLEPTPDAYVAEIIEVFRCVRDVLADDGTLWLNLGDSYAGPKGNTAMTSGKHDPGRGERMFGNVATAWGTPKQLIGIPWRVAFALQADGWYLRQDIIWHKPNPMPESVRDRCTKAHEYIFLLSKSERYYFDAEAIKEGAKTAPASRNKAAEGYHADYPKGERFSAGERVWGADGKRNKRSVWDVALRPYKGAHFATFPPALIEPCILAGSKPGDIVLDPFMGSGTTAQVSIQHGRQYIGCELNPEYATLQQERINSSSKTEQNLELF
jgi:DNA modification methylase